jgi:hypothetical protein
MVKIKIKDEKGQIFNFSLRKKEDFLSTLDKFLKKYKILKKEIKDWHFTVSKSKEDFIGYQINLAISKALNFLFSKK